MVGVELSSRFSQMVMIDVLNWFNYFEENGKHLCVKLNQLGINVPSQSKILIMKKFYIFSGQAWYYTLDVKCNDTK